MEVELQSPGGLQRVLRVSIPAERFGSAVERRLRQIGSRARVPGFRPGKAPLKVIRQQYGEQARADAIGELVRETWPEALQQVEVAPAGQPSFEVTAEAEGEPLTYNANFEVYPEIQLQDFSALKVEKPVTEVGDGDIDDLIANLRKARRSTETVSRAAQEGDLVRIDFVGSIDGEAFEGGKGENTEVEIGAGRFLPDLEQGIVGHAAGDRFEVPVQFPEDYQAEALRGKQARFEVTLNEVQEVRLPEIDDEFLQAHKVAPEAGEAGLRQKCREALEREAARASRNRLKAAALDAVLAAHPFDVPQGMVANEIERLRNETLARFNAVELNEEQKRQMVPDEILQPQATKRVALGLLLGEIIKQHKIELDQTRVEAMLDDLGGDYEDPEQVKQHYRSQPQLLQGVHAMVIEEQVVDFIVDAAEVSEKRVGLQDLLGQRGQGQ